MSEVPYSQRAERFPYPGLRPFQRDETDVFFGREKQVDELLEKIAAARFVAVVGTSGCGKSSLLRAGLIAALEAGLLVSSGPRWRVAEMRPGGRPFRHLADALLQGSALAPELRGQEDYATLLSATLRRGPLGLCEVLRDSPLPPGTNLLLVVDQFEEILRYRQEGGADEADAFVALLLATAAQAVVPVFVVIALRSDFLGDCSIFPDLPEAINASQFLTPRLTREQSQMAIEGPAKVFRGMVDSTLVTTLLNDMGTSMDQLPLLQHVLMRMWTLASDTRAQPGMVESASSKPQEVNRGPTLTLEHYQAVGGLAHALSRHADDAFLKLDGAHQHIAECMFRCLSARGQNPTATRNPMRLGAIADVIGVHWREVAAVVEVFRRPLRSFLTPPAGTPLDPDVIVDVSHESLIRQWDRLKHWVDVEGASADTYRRLEETARLWKKGEAGPLKSPELDMNLKWREQTQPNPAWAKRYGSDFELAMDFLAASERAKQDEEEAERRRAEVEQQRAEAQRQRELAQARERTEVQRRAKRRVMALAGILSAVSIVALVAAWVAWRQNARADAHKLAAQSVGLDALDSYYDLALLLGAEAYQLHPESLGTLEKLRKYLDSPIERRLFKQGHWVNAIAFRPDGKTLATGGCAKSADGEKAQRCTQGQIVLWNMATGRPSRSLPTHGDWVSSLAFSPNGKYLASSSCGAFEWKGRVCTRGEIVVWDLGTEPPQQTTLSGHSAAVAFVAFSPDGNQLASGALDGTIILWDAASGRQLADFFDDTQPVRSVAFDPKGKLLATGSGDGGVAVWDLERRRLRGRLTRGPHGSVESVAFSPDGNLLASASRVADDKTDDDAVMLWDVASLEPAALPLNGRAVAFSPTGDLLASVTRDRDITLWDVATRRSIGEPLAGHRKPVTSLAFSPDGHTVVSGAGADGVLVWDTTPRPVRSFDGPTSRKVSSVAFSPDGQTIASAGLDNQITLWEVTTGAAVELPPSEGGGAVQALAFSPKGDELASGGWNNQVILWDVRKHAQRSALTGHTDWVWSLAFGPADSRLLASGSGDRSVIVWDLETLSVRRRLEGPEGPVLAVAFSPDGTILASGEHDGGVLLWKVDKLDSPPERLNRKSEGRIPLPSMRTYTAAEKNDRAVEGLAFSPDSATLASASRDGTVTLWDVASRRQTGLLTGHDSWVLTVAFSPDGKTIATGGRDNRLILWDVETQEPRDYAIGNHSERVAGVAFSPDGRWLVSGSWDSHIRLWPIGSSPVGVDEWHARACRIAGRNLTSEERKQYLKGEQRVTCPDFPMNDETAVDAAQRAD